MRPFALALLLLAGCASTRQARLEKEKAEKARFAAEAAKKRRKTVKRVPGEAPAPRAADLKLGMTAQDARVAMGEPVKSRRMTSLDGVYDLLEYEGKNLRFKNDRLIEIQQVR